MKNPFTSSRAATIKFNKFDKFMQEAKKMFAEQEKRLIPFLEIMKKPTTNEEKIKELYEESKKKPFTYGKMRNIKGGKGVLFFTISEEAKFGEHKIFDTLAGLAYNPETGESVRFDKNRINQPKTD